MAVMLAMGHAAFANGDMLRAVESYTVAQQATSPTLRTQARLGAIRALFELEDFAHCAELGITEGDGLEGSSAPIDFAFYAFECASRLPPGPAQADAVSRTRTRIERLVERPPEEATTDDLGDLYAMAARAVRATGDTSRARALEEQGLVLLEQSVARAASPEAAQVHDYARMKAYLVLGRAEEALRMLEERCRQLPDHYEPLARLASTLGELGRPTEALAPLRRAIELSYGPRRLRYLAKLAVLLEKTGDLDASRAALREEVRGWEGLPDGQRSADDLADAQRRLGKAEAARRSAVRGSAGRDAR
jgi:tetratricopeptide (TPR) repeat protein